MRLALVVIALIQVGISGCDQQTRSAADNAPDRQQVVTRCAALVSQNQLQEGVACLQPFEQDSKPDQQTAEAAFQLGQLYEAGRGEVRLFILTPAQPPPPAPPPAKAKGK